MKNTIIPIFLSLLIIGQAAAQTSTLNRTQTMKTTRGADEYTFALSDGVTRQKVTFTNRYGITLAGDLYLPKKGGTQPLAALAISGPFGAVKEQSSGLYANAMAARGFAALAFDPSYTGESSGTPRNVASPDINTEDFSAAVDFLGLQRGIDRERIGIIGICGWAGFALNASAVDKRVKAVATTSMYDMSRVNAEGYFGSLTPEARTQMLEEMSRQRWEDAKNGTPKYPSNGLGQTNEASPQFVKEYADYYKTDRGFHPRSINSNGAWTVTNTLSFMNMPLLTYIREIAPRPMLLIAGEKAHSRYFSEDAYKAGAGPKELLIIPGAVHVDLYDQLDVIPFAKLASFFTEHLHAATEGKGAGAGRSPQNAAMDAGKEVQHIFPQGEKGPAQTFTGNAYNFPLVGQDSIYQTVIGNVYFEPGARSHWHSHPSGQILIITDGVGYHQIKGGPLQTIRKGDVVKCPPGVEHWHGASKDTGLQQLYIVPNTERGVVNWLQPVTEEEYGVK